MNNILVVGSLAYDTIQTPHGKVEKTLGGSANYFSVAASLFASVRVVGVVGEDYSDSDIEMLKNKGVDLSGMTKSNGKTFHWEGFYENDMNEAKTLKTDLNVFEHFNPILPDLYKKSQFLFLANIDPDLQHKVLEQVHFPTFVASDTMNLWINIKKDSLLNLFKKIPALLLNEGEAKLLTGCSNAISAAKIILSYGLKYVVIKRGEYGFVMASSERIFMLPAVPVSDVIDPTGAGDTFAGGFFGYLASLSKQNIAFDDLKWACIYGSVLASFTVQGFGLTALCKVTKEDIQNRLALFEQSTKHP